MSSIEKSILVPGWTTRSSSSLWRNWFVCVPIIPCNENSILMTRLTTVSPQWRNWVVCVHKIIKRLITNTNSRNVSHEWDKARTTLILKKALATEHFYRHILSFLCPQNAYCTTGVSQMHLRSQIIGRSPKILRSFWSILASVTRRKLIGSQMWPSHTERIKKMALPTKQTKMNGMLWFTHSPQKIQRKNTHGNFQFQIKPIYFKTCNKLLLRCILYIPSNWNVSIGSIKGLTPASVKPFFEPMLIKTMSYISGWNLMQCF